MGDEGKEMPETRHLRGEENNNRKDGIKTNDEMECYQGSRGRVDGLDSSGCRAE